MIPTPKITLPNCWRATNKRQSGHKAHFARVQNADMPAVPYPPNLSSQQNGQRYKPGPTYTSYLSKKCLVVAMEATPGGTESSGKKRKRRKVDNSL